MKYIMLNQEAMNCSIRRRHDNDQCRRNSEVALAQTSCGKANGKHRKTMS
jgi:hypothetical protein